MSRFLERLRSGPPIVADGGMGALISAAVPRLRCPEEANLRAPGDRLAPRRLHQRRRRVDRDKQLRGQPSKARATHYLEDEFERINSSAVKLARDAREVTGKDVFVAGSIGPLGEAATTRVRRDSFAEQVTVLEGRGADLFMVETFYDLDELVEAIEAVRSASSLPIVALMTFDEQAETLAGVSASDAAERLAPLDVAAIGANHGAGLMAALKPSRRCATRHSPRGAAKYRSRQPRRRSVIFPHATPDYFAEFAAHARDLGARLIGGCCGTTPVEIAAVRTAVEGRDSRGQDWSSRSANSSSRSGRPSARRAGACLPRGRVGRVHSARPPAREQRPGTDRGIAGARRLGRVGFVDINDNATARAG